MMALGLPVCRIVLLWLEIIVSPIPILKVHIACVEKPRPRLLIQTLKG
jgi:hypothetical protein